MNFPFYLVLGEWKIHPHLLFESLAYAIAFRLVLINTKKDMIAPQTRGSILVGGMVGALLGAKLLVVFQHIDLLWLNWQQLLLLLLHGKTVVGAMLGAVIGVEITKLIIGLKKATGDIFVYPLIIGTIVGRVGCFLTGLSDKTYGVATSLPWGIDFGDGIYRHPTQLYEIIFLIVFIIFLNIRDRYQRQSGDLFKFYMIGYLGFRLVIDFIKPDFHLLFNMSAIQIACILGLIYYYRSIPKLWQFIQIQNEHF